MPVTMQSKYGYMYVKNYVRPIILQALPIITEGGLAKSKSWEKVTPILSVHRKKVELTN